jgi:hypothetical protein
MGASDAGRVWNERGLWSAIERYRADQKKRGLTGRCYEKALLRSFELQKKDMEVRIGKGYYKGELHRWVELKDPKSGNWLVDDPAQGIKYQHNYVIRELKQYTGPFSYETPQWEITDEGAKKVYAEQGGRKGKRV